MSRFYLDHNATTPLHPEVADAMADLLGSGGGGGNPSSIHAEGRAARKMIEEAREKVAALLAVSPTELVFTSGGTEADNLALLGAAASRPSRGRHLVASTSEHSAVLEPVRRLESQGWEVTWVSPNLDGMVAPDAVFAALRPDTALATVMAANNEVGTLQPVEEIGTRLRTEGILFHCDGVQALGKIPACHPRRWNADYAAFSAHKINGPKGIGVLYVRKGAPIVAQAAGGTQERGLRGGTENVIGILGFGKAAEVWLRDGEMERARLTAMRDALSDALRGRIPDAIINGEQAPRVPNTLHITLPGCPADLMVMALDMRGLAVSAGSACASGSVKHSHVILAMGLGKEAASASLRISLGQGNRLTDVPEIVEAIASVAAAVRAN